MEKYSIKLVDAIFKDYNRTIKYSGFGYNLEMTKNRKRIWNSSKNKWN